MSGGDSLPEMAAPGAGRALAGLVQRDEKRLRNCLLFSS